MFKKLILVGVAVFFLGSVSACGKSLDQVKKTAHDLVDIAGAVYEDALDNVDAVKKVLKGEDEDSE